MKLDLQVTEIEELIRSGNREKATQLLKEIKISTIPRQHINTLANLSRRVGQLDLSWKMIAPVIRPKVTLEKPATDEEKATYAIILLGLGARSEAFEILETANNQCPDVSLASAYASINCWDYASAATKLKHYLRSQNLTPYQKMVAQVNLAAAYVVNGQAEQALVLINENLLETKQNGWDLLYRNTLEIRAQLAVQQKNWTEAEDFLKQAEHDSGQFYLDRFFVKKWQAIMRLQKESASPDALQEIENVKMVATQKQHWETIRDCEYYKSITMQDRALALNLLFGTPYESFRKRLVEKSESWLKVPKTYRWNLTGQESDRAFNLHQAEEIGGPAKMKAGTVLHKIFLVLSSDFYRPFAIGNLHSLIYPKEFFNPDSSPRRVAFLIQRLRAWFKEFDIPLFIHAEDDGFKLQASAPYSLIIEKAASKTVSKSDEPLQYLTLVKKIKTNRKGQPLRAAEIAELTDMSVRSVRYFLKWALEKKKVQKIGSGRESRYRFS